MQIDIRLIEFPLISRWRKIVFQFGEEYHRVSDPSYVISTIDQRSFTLGVTRLSCFINPISRIRLYARLLCVEIAYSERALD